jgi:hypothetical protein
MEEESDEVGQDFNSHSVESLDSESHALSEYATLVGDYGVPFSLAWVLPRNIRVQTKRP